MKECSTSKKLFMLTGIAIFIGIVLTVMFKVIKVLRLRHEYDMDDDLFDDDLDFDDEDDDETDDIVDDGNSVNNQVLPNS